MTFNIVFKLVISKNISKAWIFYLHFRLLFKCLVDSLNLLYGVFDFFQPQIFFFPSQLMAPPSPCLSPKPKIHSRSTTAFPLVPHQQSLSSLLSECFSFFHLILSLQVSHFPASILIQSAIICCLLCFVIHSHRNHHAHLKNRSPGLPWWLSGEESTCQCRRHRFDPWSGKIPHAMEQLSPCTTIEPVLHKTSHHGEKPEYHN